MKLYLQIEVYCTRFVFNITSITNSRDFRNVFMLRSFVYGCIFVTTELINQSFV